MIDRRGAAGRPGRPARLLPVLLPVLLPMLLPVLLAGLWAAGMGLLVGCGARCDGERYDEEQGAEDRGAEDRGAEEEGAEERDAEAPRRERSTSPRIRILVDAPGRRMEEVEREVVAPIEARLAPLDGLLGMASTSRAGLGELTLLFAADLDLGETLRRVRAARDGLASDLAETTWRIHVEDPADEPLSFFVTGKVPWADVSNAARQLGKLVALLPDVRRVESIGTTHPSIVVDLDPMRCRAYGLRPNAVVATLQETLNARMRGSREAGSPPVLDPRGEVLGAVVLHGAGATPITLRDVAEIRAEDLADEGQARCRGLPGILVRVHATHDARPIVARRVEAWARGLPAGIRVEHPEVEAGHAVLRLAWQVLPGESARAIDATLKRLGAALDARGGSGALVWRTAADAGRGEGGASVSLDPARAFALVEDLGRGVAGATVQRVDLEGPGAPPPLVVLIMAEDPAILDRTTTEVYRALRHVEGAAAIFHDGSLPVPTLHVEVSSKRAKALGTTREAIESQIALALEGRRLTGSGGVTVIVRSAPRARPTADLGALRIQVGAHLVPLRDLAEVSVVRAPARIRHVDGHRTITLRASVKPGASRKAVLRAARTAVEGLQLPPEVTLRWEDQEARR